MMWVPQSPKDGSRGRTGTRSCPGGEQYAPVPVFAAGREVPYHEARRQQWERAAGFGLLFLLAVLTLAPAASQLIWPPVDPHGEGCGHFARQHQDHAARQEFASSEAVRRSERGVAGRRLSGPVSPSQGSQAAVLDCVVNFAELGLHDSVLDQEGWCRDHLTSEGWLYFDDTDSFSSADAQTEPFSSFEQARKTCEQMGYSGFVLNHGVVYYRAMKPELLLHHRHGQRDSVLYMRGYSSWPAKSQQAAAASHFDSVRNTAHHVDRGHADNAHEHLGRLADRTHSHISALRKGIQGWHPHGVGKCEVQPHSLLDLWCVLLSVLVVKVLCFDFGRPGLVRFRSVEFALRVVDVLVTTLLVCGLFWRYEGLFSTDPLKAVLNGNGKFVLTLDNGAPVYGTCAEFEDWDAVVAAAHLYFGGVNALLFSLGAGCLVLAELLKLRWSTSCLLRRVIDMETLLMRLHSITSAIPGSAFHANLQKYKTRALESASTTDGHRAVDRVFRERLGEPEAQRLIFQTDLNEIAWVLVLEALAFTLWMPVEFVFISPCLGFEPNNNRHLLFGNLSFAVPDHYLGVLRTVALLFVFGAVGFAGAMAFAMHVRRDKDGVSTELQESAHSVWSRMWGRLFWFAAAYSLAFGSCNVAMPALGACALDPSQYPWRRLFKGAQPYGAQAIAEAIAQNGLAYSAFLERLLGLCPADCRQLLLAWRSLQVTLRKVLLWLQWRLGLAVRHPEALEVEVLLHTTKCQAFREIVDKLSERTDPTHGFYLRNDDTQDLLERLQELRQLSETPGRPVLVGDDNMRHIQECLRDVRSAYGVQRALQGLLMLALLPLPLVALVPFYFDYAAWGLSQVENWTFSTSAVDWVVLAAGRDVFIAAALGHASVAPWATSYRRLSALVALLVFIYGCLKVSELDWQLSGPGSFELFVPMIWLECLIALALLVGLIKSRLVEHGSRWAACGKANTYEWLDVGMDDRKQSLGSYSKDIKPCTQCERALTEGGGWQDEGGTFRLCMTCVMEIAGLTPPPEDPDEDEYLGVVSALTGSKSGRGCLAY